MLMAGARGLAVRFGRTMQLFFGPRQPPAKSGRRAAARLPSTSDNPSTETRLTLDAGDRGSLRRSPTEEPAVDRVQPPPGQDDDQQQHEPAHHLREQQRV